MARKTINEKIALAIMAQHIEYKDNNLTDCYSYDARDHEYRSCSHIEDAEIVRSFAKLKAKVQK